MLNDGCLGESVNEKEPFISVIMCAYNVAPFIEQAVFSILNQTYTNFELLISDDNSSDGTSEWLKENLEGHPKVRLFFHNQNMGYVANKNFAIANAEGDFITQNDSDDYSAPDRLEKQVAVIKRNPDAKVVGTGYAIVDHHSLILQSIHPEVEQVLFKEQQNFLFWFPGLLLHRLLFEEFGYFSPFFCGMGDDHYWTVRVNEKYPIYCIQDVLYFYRRNPNSITNVLNDDRKLYVSELIEFLLRQRRTTGTDWLESGRLSALEEFEQKLKNNKLLMADRYRQWAALYIDKGQLVEGKHLLLRSFTKAPFSLQLYRTAFYLLKKMIRTKVDGE